MTSSEHRVHSEPFATPRQKMAAEDGKDVSTSKRLPPALIHGPVTLCNSFEVSVHKVPRLFKHDMQVVLPKLDMDDMLIVPTAQRSAMDLVNWGPETAREKDLLLERVSR